MRVGPAMTRRECKAVTMHKCGAMTRHKARFCGWSVHARKVKLE